MRRNIVWVCALAALVTPLLRGTLVSAQWGGDIPGSRPTEAASPESLSDQFFRVEWSDTTDSSGRPRIAGYVYNDHEEPAMGVHLRIAEVDATGHEVATTIVPVDETVPAKGRAYFDLPVPGGATHRVSVVSFEFIEGAKS